MKLLRMRQVLMRVPVTRSTIYQWMKEGRFPKQTLLSKRCCVWREEDILEWLDKAK